MVDIGRSWEIIFGLMIHSVVIKDGWEIPRCRQNWERGNIINMNSAYLVDSPLSDF